MFLGEESQCIYLLPPNKASRVVQGFFFQKNSNVRTARLLFPRNEREKLFSTTFLLVNGPDYFLTIVGLKIEREENKETTNQECVLIIFRGQKKGELLLLPRLFKKRPMSFGDKGIREERAGALGGKKGKIISTRWFPVPLLFSSPLFIASFVFSMEIFHSLKFHSDAFMYLREKFNNLLLKKGLRAELVQKFYF